ncbi:MAG: PAS domain S-box protein, partial [Chloroflexota bacterium]
KSGAQGVVVLPEGPLLIAALPILTSQDEGPSRGTLIFGRWLNPAEIAHLAQITHLTLAIHRLDSAALPADVQTARATLSEQTPIAVRPLNEQTVAGYALVKDIYDRPALVLRAESARDIHQQGNLSKTYLIALSLGAGIVGYALITFGIERLVLSRIAHLSQNVRRVGADGDPARRVFARGDDEIFSLAREINRMLEAIQTSERRYRALFEGAPMIIYALDSAGRFTALNPAFEQITGWTSAEWLGRSFTEIVPPQDVPEMQQVFQQALHGELLQYAERRILSKTGEVVTVDLLGLPQMENDQVVGVAGFALDITERKRAADALRESEQKYRTLVENINEVIYTLDLDGRFTYVSPVVERLSAYKMENLLGRRFTDFVHPDDLPGLLESYSRTLRGEIEPFEYRIFDKNGQVRYIRSSSRLIVKDAAVVGISGVMSDITARKNAEAALR